MSAVVNARLARWFRWRVIQPDCPEGKIGRPLLTRYAVWRSRAQHTFEGRNGSKYAVFLHHFHRSDLDEFHDHPWPFITFLFHSGYWEHVPNHRWLEVHHTLQLDRTWDRHECFSDKRIWRRRFSILYRPATFQHYIEVVKPTWTLVFRLPEVRDWGFIIKGRWVQWRKAEDLKSRSICDDV